MSRRYVVTALGPDGKVQVQATHDTPDDAINALAELADGDLTLVMNRTTTTNILKLWMSGADSFEVLSRDFQTTISITIIDE
jgi:hypothetical protein